MPRAIWNDVVIAEASAGAIRRVEGSAYFPPAAVRHEFLRRSDTRTVCSWKGTAVYYHLVVNGAENRDAVWTYPEPKDAAREITGFIAFWHGVRVES
jgi:uncharacterized protein (DUF427 family)